MEKPITARVFILSSVIICTHIIIVITVNTSILCIDLFMYNTIRSYFIFSLNKKALILDHFGTPIIFSNNKKYIYLSHNTCVE